MCRLLLAIGFFRAGVQSMLRNLMGLILAVNILGPFWTIVSAALAVAGIAGLAHIVWQLLSVVTAG